MQIPIPEQVDNDTMHRFGEVCEAAGLSPNNALGIFIRGVVYHNFPLPTEPESTPDSGSDTTTSQPPPPRKPSKLPYGRGCMKGKIWIADDFDAPMEDFKDYM